MQAQRQIFGQLAEAILDGGAKKATKYINPKLTVKATLRGKRDRRYDSTTILFTVGAPNCAEREFIKKCLAADEPFPVKKIQVKYPKGKK